MADPKQPVVGLAPPARSARRLGLLGGSFDPPHLGHLHVAEAARNAFGLDHVVFFPAARPPHKLGRVLTDGAVRMEMLELLLAEVEWTSTWGVELGREGPSYTVDTVRDLRDLLGPGAQVFLLIGSDNLTGLASWFRIEELLELVQPIVVHRRGDPLDLAPFLHAVPVDPARAERWLVDVEPVDAAATDIRARLVRGEDPGPALPPALREYVAARGIYAGRDDVDS